LAIYHLHVQAISRAGGRSATSAAAYRAGEVIVEERTGEVHDYTRKRGVLHAEILAPAGAPEWVFNRADLWNKVENSEKRKDAQVCRELNIALPHELSSRQRLDLIHTYVKRNFVQHGMVADVCLHAPGRGEDSQNFHAHIMLTMRPIEADGFGKKAREWNSIGMLESWRANWAKAANEALEKAGHDARIDHRSNVARGLDDVPGQHHGPAVSGILRRGEDSEVAQRQAAERATRERAQLEAQLAIVSAQATTADAELQALEAQELAEQERLQALAEARAKEAARVERQRLEAQQAAVQAERERQDAQKAQDAAQAAAKAAQAERSQQLALAQARKAYQKAEQQLAQAEQAESAAKTAVEQLENAKDRAMLGQKNAAQSVLKTARALIKVPGWISAIKAHDAAVEAFSEARRAASTARQVVILARGELSRLEPTELARPAAQQATRTAPKAAKVGVVPAPLQAPRALMPVPVPRQVHQDPDDDDEPSVPAPGM
jgi:ATP-dependent exoDNAse (exonuclease V) alpha subunit